MATISDDRVLIVQRRLGNDDEAWLDYRQLPPLTSVEYAEILMGRMTLPAPIIEQRLIERRAVVTEEVLA